MGAIVLAHRQGAEPVEAPTASGITGAVTIDPDAAPTSTLLFDPTARPEDGPTVAPPLVSGHTPTITITPATPSPTTDPSEASSTLEASSSSSRPIALSTVIGSCVGAFIGAVALICLGLWFYRRYQRSLKSQYSKSRAPRNTRADFQRRLSHREPWGKLEDRDPEDKWEGQTKQARTDESVAPMEKLTMFKKTPSTRTAYTHTTEEAAHFEIPHPFAQQYPPYNANQSDRDDDRTNASMPVPKPFKEPDNKAAFSWGEATQGSFLTVRTQSERLSGAMSPTLNMAIPTPPATSSPFHHWESAEIMNFDGQSAEIVNPFGNDEKPTESRSNFDNPFFGAHETQPRRRSRANSVASKTQRDSSIDATHIAVPKLDKGKGRAIDPFDDDHQHVPEVRTATSPTAPTIVTSFAHTVPPSKATPTSTLPLPQPAFATHVSTMSGSSAASSEHALASLLAALDGEATHEDVQARLRIASMQPSISSGISAYSEGDEDMTHAFPLPPSTPGTSTPTIESYFTAESDQTVRQ